MRGPIMFSDDDYAEVYDEVCGVLGEAQRLELGVRITAREILAVIGIYRPRHRPPDHFPTELQRLWVAWSEEHQGNEERFRELCEGIVQDED